MAKKTVDPLKAKQKKQKMIAGVLGGVLLLVCVFEIPKTLKMMKGQSATPPPASTTPAPSATPSGPVSLAAPTLAGTPQPQTPPPNSDGLVDTHITLTPSDGQLISFGRFETKDPFAQQVKTGTAAGSSGTSGSSGSSAPPPASSPSSPVSAPPSGGSAVPPSSSPTPSTPSAPAVPAPTSAVIAVNGVQEQVNVAADFPAASPTFHLVSLTQTTAKIAIAGGSYTSGAATITLKVGKAITLMNTADGTRYRIQLFPQGTAVGGTTTPPPAPTPSIP